MCFINLKSFSLHAFCTPKHSLNLAHQEEFTWGTVLLISIRNQGKQFSREDAWKDRAAERETMGVIPFLIPPTQPRKWQCLSIITSSDCSAVWPAFVSFMCLLITYLCWKSKLNGWHTFLMSQCDRQKGHDHYCHPNICKHCFCSTALSTSLHQIGRVSCDSHAQAIYKHQLFQTKSFSLCCTEPFTLLQ